MSALLSDINPDEFVFWCIDDRFPKKVFDHQRLSTLHSFLSLAGRQHDFDGVKLTKWYGRQEKA